MLDPYYETTHIWRKTQAVSVNLVYWLLMCIDVIYHYYQFCGYPIHKQNCAADTTTLYRFTPRSSLCFSRSLRNLTPRQNDMAKHTNQVQPLMANDQRLTSHTNLSLTIMIHLPLMGSVPNYHSGNICGNTIPNIATTMGAAKFGIVGKPPATLWTIPGEWRDSTGSSNRWSCHFDDYPVRI